MDFTPTEDRRMLSDTLRRYLSDAYPFEMRNRIAYEAPFHAPERYAELADLGIVGAFVPEEKGGFGGAGFDIATVFEELGRALCPEPFLGTLMAVRALADLGRDDLVGQIVGGQIRPAFAVFEPDAGERLEDIATTAGDGRLSGRKSVVYGAPGAGLILVAAKSDKGIGLYSTTEAATVEYAMIDGSGAGEVILDGASAVTLSDDCAPIIEAALDAGRVALCAEAVGAMDVQMAATIGYMKQRSQFGRPIAAFQALQHRIVDMAIEIEQARSITILAASHLNGADRMRHVAMAKNLVGRVARLVSEESVQLHGGIGMTWEYPGAHYAKRLIMIDHQLGDAQVHLHRLMDAA